MFRIRTRGLWLGARFAQLRSRSAARVCALVGVLEVPGAVGGQAGHVDADADADADAMF